MIDNTHKKAQAPCRGSLACKVSMWMCYLDCRVLENTQMLPSLCNALLIEDAPNDNCRFLLQNATPISSEHAHPMSHDDSLMPHSQRLETRRFFYASLIPRFPLITDFTAEYTFCCTLQTPSFGEYCANRIVEQPGFWWWCNAGNSESLELRGIFAGGRDELISLKQNRKESASFDSLERPQVWFVVHRISL